MRQARDRPQGERDARVEGQRRVTAGEQQSQAVVGDLVHVVSQRLEVGDLRGGRDLVATDAIPAEPVDRAVACRREQPRGGVVGHPALRPDPKGLFAGVLPGLLRQIEVVDRPDQRRHRATRVQAERAVDDLGDLGHHMPRRGRTSMAPDSAPGSSAASAIAVSRSSTSTMK